MAKEKVKENMSGYNMHVPWSSYEVTYHTQKIFLQDRQPISTRVGTSSVSASSVHASRVTKIIFINSERELAENNNQ